MFLLLKDFLTFCFLSIFPVQEKVDLLTEKLESTGNVDTSEKQGEMGGSEGTTGATKTSVNKKTCMLIGAILQFSLEMGQNIYLANG